MKKIMLFAAASAACLSLSHANAALVASAPVNAFSVQETNAGNRQSYSASRAAYREFLGAYDLDNGARLRLTQQGRRFFVEVTGQPVFEVYAVSPDTFVSAAGDAELMFTQHANGAVSKLSFKQPART